MAKELKMKKSRYTDEQIAFALKQARPVAEVIRRMKGFGADVLPLGEGVRRSRRRRAEAFEAARG